ncbi:aminomethyl-transferring glycine dehydrogenase [Pseudoteredinibacter isoporae]|uniref:Glycine dehydrogenase (decarboxylating) n=1 Tax=Pseudoteredinibacter isoporae TaxID=570281 RepID=A0A7X0JSY9_9GAMM|nr:aminomethyl-transferring glycine dehydrogenase [Pseudoteredinibacter isoporae]MBB6521705.1 glycine dehydrogenase [Pseudoteredinibacter isoporae]NHO87253.1 aminomethyl-transferring glycine dehydrogenase [Pseudoteredinibacter isoporae]NIB23115.1 aminomethyl-transferring glycine dehydrogenase [Pseudoteredinibacter isoporae]
MLQSKKTIKELENSAEFISRHIGVNSDDQKQMLAYLGYDSMSAFIQAVVPDNIRSNGLPGLAGPSSEAAALAELKSTASKNQKFRSLIGQGYYDSQLPSVILRNLLENPAWYTAYTPYQPEISQGRLEALFNFQTLITELTGMEIANASMLDESTAAAEAMTLCQRMSKSKSRRFLVDEECLPQTIDILQTRAEPLDIELLIGDPLELGAHEDVFGVLLQYPAANGDLRDYSGLIDRIHEAKGLVAFAADPLSLLLLKSPGELGADVVIGSAQRFGVPLGFGGPHAAYMATKQAFKRSLPGRLVGSSVDSNGKPAYRLALQTREQHIRREKATSNICTAQVLLAVIASMYASYHGPDGLRKIAERVHRLSTVFALGLRQLGFEVKNKSWFDTITVLSNEQTSEIVQRAREAGINLRLIDGQQVGVSFDELSSRREVSKLWRIFNPDLDVNFDELDAQSSYVIPGNLLRNDAILTQEAFNAYHSETQMLRYLRELSDRDIALDRAMIPLGSCTMKLNASSEMLPISWPEFANVHPFVPLDQAEGYLQMIGELEDMLCEITGYDAVSLQPNSGAQGEYAGLLAVRAYHESRGEGQRDVCLIPSSAHGTNPASAQMCGMKVVVVKCDDAGNIDMLDLQEKAERHSNDLAAIMVTYPSTHGVFEESIVEVAELIHRHGGQVYVDGANLNAMVGLCQPGKFGGDVSHLNLHKTFCIPHGGGGPGVGPIGVKEHLEPFLPGHRSLSGNAQGAAVSAAPWGSASILPITWMYIRMMGASGLQQATEAAILNANYLSKRLAEHYPILYTGRNGLVAHECIVDLRPIKESSGISVDDVAKRLIDYGFHAPTMSFPVSGTLMIEPTESESKWELDRFCEAMSRIREEIHAVEDGVYSLEDNPLVHAPHTAESMLLGDWQHAYSQGLAAYPVDSLLRQKYWPPVGRVDNVYGDKHLVCSCPPMSDYE